MSSALPLQCPFCNHFNPGSASYCNDCGSPLDLQQCDLCGAINKRTASVCYKCGGAFPIAAVRGGHPPLALEDVPGRPALDYLGSANEGVTLPEAAAVALGAQHEESQAEDPKDAKYVDLTAARDATGPDHLRACSPLHAIPPSETVSSDGGAAKRRSLYLFPMAALATMLLAAIAVVVYYYQGHFKQETLEQSLKQTVPAESGDSIPSGTAPSPLATRADAESTQAGTMGNFAGRVFGFDPDPSLAPPDAGAAIKKGASPATDREVKTPQQAQAIGKECQEAVAALGLCNSMPKKEKP